MSIAFAVGQALLPKLSILFSISAPCAHFLSLKALVSFCTGPALAHRPLLCSACRRRYLNTVTVSPDGSLCASGGKDGTAMLWDLKEGKRLYSLDAGDIIHSLVFSPNRYWLCAATTAGIKVRSLPPYSTEYTFCAKYKLYPSEMCALGFRRTCSRLIARRY